MEKTLLIIIIAIIIFDYLLERWLDYLNSKRWSNELPAELKDIYDEDKYRKSQDYLKVNQKFGALTSSFSLVLILALLLLGGFGWVDQLVRQITNHPILVAILFFGLLGFASDLVSTPFQLYDTFMIEERFGFNRTTIKTYILDKIKGWLLSIIIGGGLFAALIWFYITAGSNFWLYAWLLFTGFSIFMSMFYSTLIVPLFNKQTPLEGGELRDAIENLATKAGFKLENIFVIDGSKRSTKANAYFSGLGPKKRIVLFDTLINDHPRHELLAVLAHEIGHYKKKHTLKGMVVSVLTMGLMLFLLGLFVNRPELSLALGGQQASFHLGILAFGLLYSPISMILGIIGNVMSRKYEYEADAFAATQYEAGSLMDALKRLSVNNLSNLRPHPINVFIGYSHPPLLQRLNHLNQFAR